MKLRIDDKTRRFSESQKQALLNFINHDLLSTETETEWLGVIIIREDARSGYRGYWTFQQRFDKQNQIDGIVAVVVLNYYYVKTLDPAKALDEFKKVLAHEYGHHWTLSYLVVNHQYDVWRELMPEQYYRLRQLNRQDCTHDYSKGWHCCDKEVIAEDYRVLFAPNPYNNNHQIVDHFGDGFQLPNQGVRQYIEDLQNL